MTAPAAPRLARGGTVRGGTPEAVQRPPELTRPGALLPPAAAGGAAALALSSTGSMVVAAALLGVASRSRWSGVAAVLAVVAVAVRFSTASFDDVAGIQSVLGAAGTVGPPVAAASAWTAAAAVLLAVRGAPSRPGARLLPAVAGGALAAAIVVGPGPGGGLAWRVAATIVAIAIGVALGATDRHARLGRLRPGLAVGAGMVAVVLAAWPG